GLRLRMVRGCKDGSRGVRRRAPGQATSPEGVTAMDRTALRQALCEILEEETGRTYIALGEGTDLRAGLGLDSVDMVSLVIHLQTRFRIQITTEELEKVVRVGDLLDLLQLRLPAQAA